MSWTDDKVETLKRMWAEGHSASTIAKELKDVTRNAVIGKVHRLGLSNRVPPGDKAADAAGSAFDAGVDAPGPDAAAAEPVLPLDEPAPAPFAARGTAVGAADDLDAFEEPAEADDEGEVDEEEDEDGDDAPEPVLPFRRPIIPAGQPLPPQPSLNEVSPEALAKVTEVEKVAKRLTLMELTEKTCKWPVGDPATANFWFCGLPVQVGKPYCEAHVGVAFQPMSARRDRRR